MARLRYYPTPADFAVGFGEQVPLLDESEEPVSGDPTGRLVAVPEASVEFEVCTDDDYDDVTTDLLVDGEPATVWATSEDFATLGRGPVLEGPDGHEGPLYLTPDAGTTFYRIEPDSAGLYGRVGALEGAGPLSTTDLADWSDTPATNGQFPQWNNGTGEWEAVTVAPGGGASNLGDLSDVDLGGATTGTTILRGSDGVYRPGSSAATWPVSGTPSTFPPSSHTHDTTDLRVSSSPLAAFLLTMLAASTQEAARNAIGATNLALGPGASEAAAGNHTHSDLLTVSAAQAGLFTGVAVSTGSESRPSGYVFVIWVGGESPPNNAEPGDIWLEAVA